jgi:hypothetical protein
MATETGKSPDNRVTQKEYFHDQRLRSRKNTEHLVKRIKSGDTFIPLAL